MQPKPGVKSSEFYLTVVTSLTGLLVSLGYLQPEDADVFASGIISIIGGFMVVVPVAMYTVERLKLKREVLKQEVIQSGAPTQEINYPPTAGPAAPAENPTQIPI